ncbi:hypothetical protein AB1K91_11530 [Terribacillus sp. 179-K 1B1 HS]
MLKCVRTLTMSAVICGVYYTTSVVQVNSSILLKPVFIPSNINLASV